MTAPILSVILMSPGPAPRPEWLARPEVAEVIIVQGAFGELRTPFIEAAGKATGELVFAVTADAAMPETAWPAILEAAAANPDAGALRLSVQGLVADPAWRGRRA